MNSLQEVLQEDLCSLRAAVGSMPHRWDPLNYQVSQSLLSDRIQHAIISMEPAPCIHFHLGGKFRCWAVRLAWFNCCLCELCNGYVCSWQSQVVQIRLCWRTWLQMLQHPPTLPKHLDRRFRAPPRLLPAILVLKPIFVPMFCFLYCKNVCI